ncbi:acetyltransferase [Croceibacterium mercuriale]|uniref:Acetyltransferase n=1 Tax=Croceibacterium mercuriale TaxID=1572751 RepID=A0A0B2BX64_9SPHN|nr:GNAT family N-acetyltransferase [Croceibacterium mercuriale]KHL24592.1 acetyltransferase [Croceibacterium mercuriale]
MSAADITRTDETTHGAYQVAVPGSARPAELTWRARGSSRVADHTFVPPEARGGGIAMQLVEALVADAKAEGFTIEPACSYVEAAFRRHPEWADLRAPIPS